MILKEVLGRTDDELVESLMFDIRYQYALHTTSYEEQPLSDRTFSRFRERCTVYETETGIDLINNCINDLSSQIAKIMKINKGLNRMDRMMIASNIKKLPRLQLLYTCVANQVKLMLNEKITYLKNLNIIVKQMIRIKLFIICEAKIQMIR